MDYKQAQPDDIKYITLALQEATQGLKEGGIPVGSVLVIDGQVVGKGHNRRVQSGNPILHGEMDCLQNAGRLKSDDYLKATIYTTLSPCPMCSGAILHYKIPRVVMAENKNYRGAEDLLMSKNIELMNLNMFEAVEMMEKFIKEHPDIWNEDIGT